MFLNCTTKNHKMTQNLLRLIVCDDYMLPINAIAEAVDHLAEPVLDIDNFILKSKRKKSNKFYETIPAFTSEQFFNEFKISREGVQNLIGKIILKSARNFNEIVLKKRFLFYLWIMGRTEALSSGAELFGFTSLEAEEYFFEIVSLVNNLKDDFIEWPNKEWYDEIAQETELRCGMPGILGFINCDFIQINNGDESVGLQLVCDCNNKITDFHVGTGNQTDVESVFYQSVIYKNMVECSLIPTKLHLLGPKMYPLLPNLLTPYDDGESELQEKYNATHASEMDAIAITFVLLKEKWQRLQNYNLHSEKVADVICSACILQNYCLQNFEDMPSDVVINISDSPAIAQAIKSKKAIAKRDFIATML